MSNALITLPHLQDVGITFDARELCHWLPSSVAPEPELLAIKINALLAQTLAGCFAMNSERGWRPKSTQLGLALMTLVYTGVDMGPASKECCLLSYWDKEEHKHNVAPYIMKAGLKRLASDQYPISHDSTRIVVKGDQWKHVETDEKTVVEWKAGEERNRAVLENLSGALGVIVALWTRISMLGRPAFNGVLEGFHLREVLQGNTQAKYGKATWGTNFVAMLRKTSLIHTYRQLPLTGRPAAAMNLATMADAGQLSEMRQHLLDAGQEQGISTDGLSILDSEPGAYADAGEQDSDDEQAPFEFVAQEPSTKVESDLDKYVRDAHGLKKLLYDQLEAHDFAKCRETCGMIRTVWAKHMSVEFKDDEVQRIEDSVQ